ncbi:MAG: FtsK/SpoIIIE domain-containing protein, partial [Firmicutes bacterium]|nr:FtsK/SpoIIIE domain-containing protein [Bacillota bacterium]
MKEKTIEHNDYVSVENFDDNLLFSMLFVENSKLSLNGKAYELTDNIITIGRAEDNIICLCANESISRRHAIIAKDKNGKYRIESAKDKANFYVNGFLEHSKELNIGDVIQIFSTKILFLGKEICIYGGSNVKLRKVNDFNLASVNREKTKTDLFIRTPRIITGYKTEPVEIDLPPPSQKIKPMPAILTIGPSLTMSLAMFVTLGVMLSNYTEGSSMTSLISGGALAFSMLLGAILWPVLTRAYQKKQSRKIESLRINGYSGYIKEIRTELARDNQNNRKLLNEVFFPSPEVISKIIKDDKLSRRMFEKIRSDSDYLSVRIGSGKIASSIEVKAAKQDFSLDQDLLLKLPYEAANEFKAMDNMPVAISLKQNKTIGIIGDRLNVDNLIRSLFMSLTFGHSYDEVKTVFIFKNDEKYKFEEYKKALHTKTDNEEYRLIATTKEEVHVLFSYISELIDQQEQAGEKKDEQIYPFFVFFIFDRDLVEGEPFFKRIVNPKEDDNFCSLFIYKSILKLPKECKIIIQADNEKCGFFSKENNTNNFQNFVLDKIDRSVFINYINFLQNIRIKIDVKEAGVPEKVSFMGLYKAGSIEDLNIKKRWEENCSYKSIQAPIGIKSGGELFSLNIHENFHGPHGLVAGMTGSGKSELLQTLILSLAINYHPNDVSFILIDFKGGGMANVFDGMPHLAGKITNLSGSALRRSLVSIDAEKERRQSIFKEAGVNNIDQYQKLFKKGGREPLPHLVIIVDEFAQLKVQQPEFMRKIIDIAQIGRSLGIHLLLATQKPAGVVDDQIWGNSRFRMCLKVLEKQDSHEMIKKPDAAFIKLPGRCYVQVGYDEVYEFIQSG